MVFADNVQLIHGPPGCGKTTYLAREAAEAARAYGAGAVLISSLTRTAAHEVQARKLPIPASQVGTLHSFAFRALGLREKQVASIESSPLRGHYAVSEYSRLRSSRSRRETWPEDVQEFAAYWEKWKRERHLYDFDDMLERAVRETTHAPGKPRFIFLDESQDHSAADLRLAAHWAKKCEKLVLIGDVDQCIFSFRGADPSLFMGVPAARRSVLSQSYRLPHAVHRYAMKWIDQVRSRDRVEYQPRDFEGKVRRGRSHYKNVEHLVHEIREETTKDRSVMVLAACGYMLHPLMSALHREGIPFHNPYKPDQAEWNSTVEGSEVLAGGPRPILGTIHSVKGGEADVVIVIPDISWSSWEMWQSGERDEILRMFYVAFTRAREELVLLQPATSRALKWLRIPRKRSKRGALELVRGLGAELDGIRRHTAL